jgi:ribosomal protein S28E/S33
MALPTPTIRWIAERVGRAGEVVTPTAVPEALNRADISRVIERGAVAPMRVASVIGVASVTVGIAGNGQQ